MSASRPLVTATADLDELDAITSPIELARYIGELARRFGTLPRNLAARRRDALVAARKTASAIDIAEDLGLSAARISQITRPKLVAAQEAAA